jgi:hypothetical protein
MWDAILQFISDISHGVFDILTFGFADDYPYFIDIGPDVQVQQPYRVNSYYPSILHHSAEVCFTPEQYSNMHILLNTLHTIADTQIVYRGPRQPQVLINFFSPSTWLLQHTLEQLLYLHNLTGSLSIGYNFFTFCPLSSIPYIPLQPNFFDYARFATPEFDTLFRLLHEMFSDLKNAKGHQVQLAFDLLNSEVDHFLTRTPVNLFKNHPILSVSQPKSLFSEILTYVIHQSVNFFFNFN